MIQGVKHIIFDLGGVLLNIDYKLTEQAFIDLGITNFPELYSQLKQTKLFDELETGKIEESAFIAGIQQIAPTPLSEEQIRNAWNAMLLDMPARRFQILQQLRLYYDLALLSNTNSIHEAQFMADIQQTHGVIFNAFFDRVYFSHRIGLRKPSKEVFEFVMQENGFQPKDTLFIDDSPQHIESAQQLGIQTIWLQPGMTIEKDVFLPKVKE